MFSLSTGTCGGIYLNLFAGFSFYIVLPSIFACNFRWSVTSEIEKIAKWTKDEQINENSYLLYNQVNLLDEFSGGE